MSLDSLELQQRPILTYVGDVPTIVEIAPTIVFGCEKMFSSLRTRLIKNREEAVQV
jgi:hypothetical protein